MVTADLSDALGELEDGETEVGFSVILPTEPAVEGGWVYLSVHKVWGSRRARVRTDDFDFGLSLGVPSGKELVVAFPRPNTEERDPLPEGTISFNELASLLDKIAELVYGTKKGEV